VADHRLDVVERGRRVSFTLDGEKVSAYEGETVAAALVAADRWLIYCNMGVCYECLVIHEGRTVRSCLLEVQDGMELRSWGGGGS
jgi:predicted molibdopterin-dependent oxidoreductase YjgC